MRSSRWFTFVEIVLTVAAWGWLVAALPFLSDAACNTFVELGLLASGALIGLAWVVLTALRLSLLPGSFRWQWLSVPLAGILGFALLVTDWDLAVRVALSESALRRHVESVPPDAPSDETQRWIGLFHVEETEEYDGAVYLFTCQSFINRHGVAYIPPGSKVAPRMRVSHLYGSWYSFEWRF
jgi:hypothetical protein